jgi:hypothetical protein
MSILNAGLICTCERESQKAPTSGVGAFCDQTEWGRGLVGYIQFLARENQARVRANGGLIGVVYLVYIVLGLVAIELLGNRGQTIARLDCVAR